MTSKRKNVWVFVEIMSAFLTERRQRGGTKDLQRRDLSVVGPSGCSYAPPSLYGDVTTPTILWSSSKKWSTFSSVQFSTVNLAV